MAGLVTVNVPGGNAAGGATGAVRGAVSLMPSALVITSVVLASGALGSVAVSSAPPSMGTIAVVGVTVGKRLRTPLA